MRWLSLAPYVLLRHLQDSSFRGSGITGWHCFNAWVSGCCGTWQKRINREVSNDKTFYNVLHSYWRWRPEGIIANNRMWAWHNCYRSRFHLWCRGGREILSRDVIELLITDCPSYFGCYVPFWKNVCSDCWHNEICSEVKLTSFLILIFPLPSTRECKHTILQISCPNQANRRCPNVCESQSGCRSFFTPLVAIWPGSSSKLVRAMKRTGSPHWW